MRAKYERNRITVSDAFGKEMESEMISVLRTYFMKDKGKYTFVDCIGTEADTFEGTDCIVYGIPVDIAASRRKDNAEYFENRIYLFGGVYINFGVRTGNSYNGYTEFEKPVLVWEFAGMPNFYMRRFMENIKDAFRKAIPDIINVASDIYFDWCEENGVVV